MKLELKKIYHNERFSEETNCFTADLYVDGVKVAYAENEGHGGPTNISPYPGMKAKLEEVENWAKAQPPVKSEEFQMELPCDLEGMVDDLLMEHLIAKDKAKFEKKLLKNMDKGICYGTKDSYSILSWKGHTIPQKLASETGRAAIQVKVNDLVAKGNKILNTNLIGIHIPKTELELLKERHAGIIETLKTIDQDTDKAVTLIGERDDLAVKIGLLEESHA